jgi:hypothetical protein
MDLSGHPRVLYLEQETVLVRSIGLGQTTDEVRRTVYSLAEADSNIHRTIRRKLPIRLVSGSKEI